MFGLEYVLAFIKVCIQVALAIVSAIPCEACHAVIPTYFAEYIPEQLHIIPYWHFVGIILVFSFLGDQIMKVSPKIISITQEVKKNDKDN